MTEWLMIQIEKKTLQQEQAGKSDNWNSVFNTVSGDGQLTT